jgi:tetratricopeptide (TPR) repeat protein
MIGSQLFLRNIFHGDAGWAVLLAPLFMAPSAGVAIIAFALSLVFAGWNVHAEASEPSQDSREDRAWLVRRGLLGGAAAVVCVLLVLAFFGVRSHLAHIDDPGDHVKEGLALYEQGRVTEAIAQYQKALKARPDNVEAYCNLGSALAAKGKFDEALVQYRKALMIKPDYAEAHYRMGLALAVKGRQLEAVAEFRKAVTIKPDFVEAREHLDKAMQAGGMKKPPQSSEGTAW